MNLTLEHMLHSVFDGLNVHVDSTVFLHLRCFGRSTDSSGRNNQCTQICGSPLNPKTSMRVHNSCVGLIHPKALRMVERWRWKKFSQVMTRRIFRWDAVLGGWRDLCLEKEMMDCKICWKVKNFFQLASTSVYFRALPCAFVV